MREIADTADTAGQLTRHAGALRALGHELLANDGETDDLVQETYLAALRRAPDQRSGLRPWLLAVARKLAYRSNRAAQRRRRWETVAANEEPVPAASDVAAETEVLRQLASLVHELEEPFRAALHLRYWHGLAPNQIAERLGIPRNTVRSQLQRGLQRLRGRMDRESADRRAWVRLDGPLQPNQNLGRG